MNSRCFLELNTPDADVELLEPGEWTLSEYEPGDWGAMRWLMSDM